MKGGRKCCGASLSLSREEREGCLFRFRHRRKEEFEENFRSVVVKEREKKKRKARTNEIKGKKTFTLSYGRKDTGGKDYPRMTKKGRGGKSRLFRAGLSVVCQIGKKKGVRRR